MNKHRILIVDDDVETRETYAEVFRNASFEVLEAQDGLEGMDIATKEKPDIIFTGIIMPRMDGFSMMEELQKNVATAGIPVVISSHMGREQDQQKANVLGAKDFILRGMTSPREVVQKIQSLLTASGSYRLAIDQYSFDAQKLAKEINFSAKLNCLECNEKLCLEIKVKNPQENNFQARFICPNCGWEAK